MTDQTPGQHHPQHQHRDQQPPHQHTAAQRSHPQHADPQQSVPQPPGAPQSHPAQSHPAQPYPAQPHTGGQPYPGQPYAGQPYRGPYPAPQPPKRSTPVWPWVLIGAMVLLCGGCFGIAGLASNSADEASSTSTFTTGDPAAAPEETAPEETAPPKSDAAPAGAAVRDGKFEFLVTAVGAPVKTVGDNQFLQTTAQGEYILVNVSVTNIGDRPQTYFGSNQTLFDDQGRRFENDTMAEINLHDHTATTINPGNTIEVVLAFDVPVGTVPDKLQLHDSMFSGGAKVALR